MIFNFSTPFQWFRRSHQPQLSAHLPRLLWDKSVQPKYVQKCATTQHIKSLFDRLDWHSLPKTLGKGRTGFRTIPLCAYVGAYLVKIEYGLRTFGQLHRFLRDHPALIWALGFPLVSSRTHQHHFDVEKSLPVQRHFSTRLSQLPNDILQNLLDSQVSWLQTHLGEQFGQTVSIDTKHILAWVRENNPKQFVEERHDKNKQPKGDPDCKLGCKRRTNQVTPAKEGQSASEKVSIGEYYWGYASGVVATKVPDVGEFILAEMTQTFDHADVTYFLPLMGQVENRLGFRPKYGTADAAFDAFYTYDYFHNEEHDGFAAIPLREMKHKKQFDENGTLLCDAQLPMTLRGTFINRSSAVQHQKGRYGCPLIHPEKIAATCPIDHKKWADGGCKSVIPTCSGARIRYQLDRESAKFKETYDQRTAVERIFSQAVALEIERPKLRNHTSISNHNTLIYILINARTIQRAISTQKIRLG